MANEFKQTDMLEDGNTEVFEGCRVVRLGVVDGGAYAVANRGNLTTSACHAHGAAPRATVETLTRTGDEHSHRLVFRKKLVTFSGFDGFSVEASLPPRKLDFLA